MLIKGIKPVAYLVLGYCIETAQRMGEPFIWANLKDMEAALKSYAARKDLPLNLSLGHIRAALLYLEGGYVTVERDAQEKGRDILHPFRIRVNPSGKAFFSKLAEEVGYPVHNITGTTP